MSFSDNKLNVAVDNGMSMQIFNELWNLHKEPLMDGLKEINTICAHWDDIGHTKKRAASLHDGTIQPVTLIDGRDLWQGLFQLDVEYKVNTRQIDGVEIISDEEMISLIPKVQIT